MSDRSDLDPTETRRRLAAAEAELTRLRKEVEDLGALVGATHQRGDLSMRGQLRCPACGSRRLLHAREVLDRGDANNREKMALVKPSIWRNRVLGVFETFVCAQCGLVEWYVQDLDQLLDKLGSLQKVLRLIENQEPESNGPYR